MFKIQIEWKLADGKSFEEWTIPWEIAQAEKETNTFSSTQIGRAHV